ncbi:glycoside hydrolase family 38 C-terminal domain-containing protein [Cohnella caldifontis]|uniref:glycoside hydrolase family 38 N-terminal domain-containing protein n=1 Tax=Cohnella caldifontis TaxID=3027471 RepID=UPI0023EC59AF|nr:glycoside hydrolase family 38 C-terminal domain-containing protein [Cohnella sp. YIM B05605]
MPKIKTFYFVNHSHTDIGFTDYQDVCFRQHMEYIDYALEMCERTADYPEEARAKWVCEVTGVTEKYLNACSSSQLERFLHWHKAGQIDIAGMQYNLTPLLNVEQLHRTLYPVKRLRDRFGVDIRVAMNCDVDGASWILADLLPEMGIELFTMSINPVRGSVPKPRPSAFWWEGPAGGKLLAWNGYHYLFGGLAGLGHRELADKFVPGIVSKLENDPDYPFDFVYGPATNPVRVDNGPPDVRLYDFIREWNEAGKTPRMALITVSELNRLLRAEYADKLRTVKGDWLDWWCDGVASSAFETGLNRSTHELLHGSEMMGAWLHALGEKGWDVQRLTQAYESMTLYDEHTWGAFSSIESPNGLFTRSQWNKKANYAYQAAAEAHDILARAARRLASGLARQEDEVRFDLGHLPPELAKPAPTYQELLVLNTLPHDREIVVEEPIRRGGQAPNGMLEMFMPRGLTWGIKPDAEGRRVAGKVAGFGYAFLPLADAPKGDDLKAGPGTIENAYYRIRIDPASGGLSEFYDKRLNYDFAGTYRGWRIGQYVYEWVDSPKGRDALYESDWSNEYFGTGVRDTPFRRETPTEVEIAEPTLTAYEARIAVTIRAQGIRAATCTFVLPTNERSLSIHWLLDKEHVTDPESVYIAFPFRLQEPRFRADINGIALTPDREQLPGTVRDWFPIQRWIDVGDGRRGVTLVPLDAPLVQLGGITTGRWAEELNAESPTVMSWALNNHWMVNFKASQGGQIPLRYKLTTHDGTAKDADRARFGAEAVTPPIVLRDFVRRDGVKPAGRFMEVEGAEPFWITAKPAEDGNGVIVRVQNMEEQAGGCRISFPELRPVSAHLVSPAEENLRELEWAGGAVACEVPGRAVRSYRISFR